MDSPNIHLQSKNDPPSHEINQAVNVSSSYHQNSSCVVSFVEEDKLAVASPQTALKEVCSKHYSILNCTERVFLILTLCLIFLVVICIAFVLGLVALALVYSCLLLISLATLPLLLVSLLMTRAFQFIRSGYSYKKLTKFKHLIRGWLYIDVAMVLVGVWIFFPVAKYAPSVKQVMLLNLSLTKWVVVITIVCAFYLVSYLIYSFTHRLTRILNVTLNVAQAFSETIDCLLVWWAQHEVTKRVPAFKYHEILGLPTRKWIRVSIFMLIGYNLITLFTHIAVMTLRRVCKEVKQGKQDSKVAHNSLWQTVIGKHFHKKFVVYFANGMKLSISFIMSSLLLLLTWVLYFGSRLDTKIGIAKSTWEYGLWTFVSALICSFFWLIKTFVLLAWDAHTVYHRLESEIKSISEQLYFLGILGYKKHDILRLRHSLSEAASTAETSERNERSFTFTKCFSYFTCISWFQSIPKIARKNLNFAKRVEGIPEGIHEDLLIREVPDPTFDDLQRASDYFLVAKRLLLEETYISDILQIFHQTDDVNKRDKLRQVFGHREESHLIPKKSSKEKSTLSQNEKETTIEDEQKDVPELAQTFNNSSCGKESNNFDHFEKLLKLPKDTTDISFDHIKTWVERAHRHCVFLANTLSSADEVAGGLNKIISCLLIGGIFIMWLLLTGLATTKVLVLIASPLLAATFIFGEACKTLFEGILFVYVIHPLDVGDLCVIDGDMIEVTAIGIWTTTFRKVVKLGTQEVVIYPNIELAKKVIINHKTKFDWRDCVKFNLGNMNSINIKNQEDILKIFTIHFEEENKGLVSSYDMKISVMEESDCMKLVVRLTYNDKEDNFKDLTYSECLREKDKLRADFCLIMNDVISKFKAEQKNKTSASSTKDESIFTKSLAEVIGANGATGATAAATIASQANSTSST